MTRCDADTFAARFDRPPETVWWAPGRVNLVGEHTDYNDGYVLPVAIPRGVTCAAALRDDGVVRVGSLQVRGEPVRARIDDLRPGAITGWAAYPLGVVWAVRQAGVDLGGADLLIDGDVPAGAGLSSSAAVEVAAAAALDDLTGAGIAQRGPMALAVLARKAENDFVGVPCGIMDQAASLLARPWHAVFLDTHKTVARAVPFDPAEHGLSLVVIDTRAPHRLVDGEYAARRAACHHAADTLGLSSLREVRPADLAAALGRLDHDVLRRCTRHVVTENARVLLAVRYLDDGDLRRLGPLLTASHRSLRDDYQVSSPELDLAVDAALDAGAIGARMTGGGFGGCTIALVERHRSDRVTEAVRHAFHRAQLHQPAWFTLNPGPGAHRVPAASTNA